MTHISSLDFCKAPCSLCYNNLPSPMNPQAHIRSSEGAGHAVGVGREGEGRVLESVGQGTGTRLLAAAKVDE